MFGWGKNKEQEKKTEQNEHLIALRLDVEMLKAKCASLEVQIETVRNSKNRKAPILSEEEAGSPFQGLSKEEREFLMTTIEYQDWDRKQRNNKHGNSQ